MSLPGDWLHRVSAIYLDPVVVKSLIEPTIADFQHEVARAGQASGARLLAHVRGYIATLRVLLIHSQVWRCAVRRFVPFLAGLVVFLVCYSVPAMWAGATFRFAPVLPAFFVAFAAVVYLPVLVGLRRWLHSPVAFAIVGAALFPLAMLGLNFTAGLFGKSLFEWDQPIHGPVLLFLPALPYAFIISGAVLGWLLAQRTKALRGNTN
jgi:hypothetical protein